jgi:hypothetical protein
MTRKTWIGVVALIAVFGLVAPLAAGDAERTCLKCRVKGFVGAMRSGDVDRSVSYLARDFELQSSGGGQRIDRDAMRSILEWDAALHGKMTFADLEWEDDIVRGTFTEWNDLYELLGIEPQRYRIEFRFRGDLIREQIYEVLDSDGPSMDEALEPVIEWAAADRPADLEAIYPDGRRVYTADAATGWVELVRAWRAASGLAAAR